MKLTAIQIAALRAYAEAGSEGVSARNSNWARLTKWSLVKKGLLQEHRGQPIWRLHSITDAGRAALAEIDAP